MTGDSVASEYSREISSNDAILVVAMAMLDCFVTRAIAELSVHHRNKVGIRVLNKVQIL
jgi:hypothetical protein